MGVVWGPCSMPRAQPVSSGLDVPTNVAGHEGAGQARALWEDARAGHWVLVRASWAPSSCSGRHTSVAVGPWCGQRSSSL